MTEKLKIKKITEENDQVNPTISEEIYNVIRSSLFTITIFLASQVVLIKILLLQ